MKTETLTVEFLKKIWASDVDDDGLAWGIYRVLRDNGQEATIKGKLDPCMFVGDLVFDVAGKWEKDPKYGFQFKFHTYSRRQPNGEWGTIAFLKQARGIGTVTAQEIYDTYKEDSINRVINNPSEVSERCNIRLELLEEAALRLAPLLAESAAKIPLMSLLKGTSIPMRVAGYIVSSKMNDPVNRIKSNPFILMQFAGTGFKQCDSLRIKLGLPSNMPERIAAACEQVFTNTSDQTWITEQDVCKGMTSLLETAVSDASQQIQSLMDSQKLVKKICDKTPWYALTYHAFNEESVATQLAMRIASKDSRWPIEKIMADKDLTDHQKEVIVHNMKFGGRLIILPGSPGTGKTFALSKILSAFDGYTYACAPTGKAAQRLTENLNGDTATTIHRMLEPVPLGDGFSFRIQGGISGYVDADLIAVDESSMVNNELAAAMFRGISQDTHIILVGDQNQLPPVGPGTMLRDLQTLGFRELTEIQRNSGKIVETCARIRDNKEFTIMPSMTPGTNVKPDTNVQLVLASKDEKKKKAIEKLVDRLVSGEVDGITMNNILEDVQFITATHANQHVGRTKLNSMLQKILNPNAKGEHDHYKVGDKIICTSNCHIENSKDNKSFVANGELGYVVESHKKRIVVKMNNTPGLLKVPCGAEIGNGWDLGYCITCHKAQGSEWPVVITVMGSDYGSSMVMCREWLYTALSRAKDCAIVVTTPSLVREVCKKVRTWDRKSFITETMRGMTNANNEMPLEAIN